MFVEPGYDFEVFCLHCRKLWAATVYQAYESREVFDRSNLLECPWCKHHSSIAARPEHKEEAINGYAYPPRIQYEEKTTPPRE